MGVCVETFFYDFGPDEVSKTEVSDRSLVRGTRTVTPFCIYHKLLYPDVDNTYGHFQRLMWPTSGSLVEKEL